MKKHDVSYHDHDDSISFHFDHCNHLEASERSFSNQSTKKKDFFPKRIFSDQSEIIENKEIKFFLEKTNNSKMILKRLNERSERLIERRMNEP
jgi:ubiquinone biosynthesis protein UbiJ